MALNDSSGYYEQISTKETGLKKYRKIANTIAKIKSWKYSVLYAGLFSRKAVYRWRLTFAFG